MAVRSKVGIIKDGFMPGTPKKTRQGSGKHTKYAATSRNEKRKTYRGQGR
jgi:DNA-binding protein H-NS